MAETQVNGQAEASKIEREEREEREERTFQGSTKAASKRSLDSDTQREDDRDSKRRKGTALIKEEYLIHGDETVRTADDGAANDDDAESRHHVDRQPSSNNAKRREKQSGQNKNRRFGNIRDEVGLCSSRQHAPEFSPGNCQFGERCKFEHDIRRYLKEHKLQDLTTFNGICPVWQSKGKCEVGWKCRFVGSHSKEVDHKDGRQELVLTEDASKFDSAESSTCNTIDVKDRITLTKKKYPTPKSDVYLKWLDSTAQKPEDQGRSTNQHQPKSKPKGNEDRNSSSPEADNRSTYVEPPLLPSEKRRLYFGPETPVLAPLTTQGNLPFRRLCVSLGASLTYSEMAMSLPLLQGAKPEWALVKAHTSELTPLNFTTGKPNIVYEYPYSPSTDIKFSAQISASKPWLALKTTEVLTTLLPQGFRTIDLNCGCPIDLVYREGAGSALMDSPNKLAKMIRGMNVVSGATPISCKIRMGTKDHHPTAQKLVERLVLGSTAGNSPPSGVAAITLHGRSRQQRYTRLADWDYISQTSSLIKSLNAKSSREAELTSQPSPEATLINSITQKSDQLTDTIHEPDARDLPNGSQSTPTFFIGNGDIYSPQHYFSHIESTQCSTLMLARGALIKPWLFSEIASNQLLDKRSSERLTYISDFVKYGLEHWGSDTQGVSTTRRFLLEWLSFTCRYIPIGLLEVLPPELNERAPRFRARDEMEQLMASDNYNDWIKMSEMFLGKAEEGFRFVPKHKSNAYEAEG